MACLLSSRKTYTCFLQNIEITSTYMWISLFDKVINNGNEMNIQRTYPSPSFNFVNIQPKYIFNEDIIIKRLPLSKYPSIK